MHQVIAYSNIEVLAALRKRGITVSNVFTQLERGVFPPSSRIFAAGTAKEAVAVMRHFREEWGAQLDDLRQFFLRSLFCPLIENNHPLSTAFLKKELAFAPQFRDCCSCVDRKTCDEIAGKYAAIVDELHKNWGLDVRDIIWCMRGNVMIVPIVPK